MNTIAKKVPFIKKALADVHLEELIKGSSSAFLFRVAGLGVGYLLTLIIAQKYGAATLGIYSLSITLMSMLAMLGRLGLDSFIIRFIAEYTSKGQYDLVGDIYKKSVKLIIPLGLFISLVIFLISPFLARIFFDNESMSIHFKLSAIGILPLSLLILNSAAFTGLKKISMSTFLQYVSIAIIAVPLLAVCSFFIMTRAEIPLSAYLAGIIFSAILSQYFWSRRTKPECDDKGKYGRLQIGDMLKIALPMLLSSSMQYSMLWINTAMIGIMGTEKDVGIFSVAMKIAFLPGITLFAIKSIAAPKFAELHAAEAADDLASVVYKSSKMIFWLSVPMLVILLISPSFFMGIFGEEFKAGSLALTLLLIGSFINAFSGSVGSLMQMTGKHNVFQLIVFIGTIVNIAMNVVLVPLYGINGAALATLACYTIWNMASVIYVKKHYKFSTIYLPLMKRRRR